MRRESFVFYRGFSECIKELDKDVRCECYESLINYALDGIEPDANGVVLAVFKAFKPQIDANNRRYANGQKGGRPKNQIETKAKPKQNQTETIMHPNVNVNVNDNENVNVNASGSDGDTLTRPPTVKEVVQAAKELGYHMTEIEAQKFIDYNDALGWKLKPSYALQKWFENRSQMNRSPAGKFMNFPQRHDAENYEMKMKIINGQIGGNL